MGITPMKIIDLTHSISPDMPVYPGTEQPVFETGCTIEKNGFLEQKMSFFSHTGTHMDAPAHMIENGKTLDQLSMEHFYGEALMVDVSKSNRPIIGIDAFASHGEILEQIGFLLIYTGWSRYWHSDRYFSDYPVLSVEAAKWLCRFNLKGIGLDAISADTADSTDFPIHMVIMPNNTVIIGNLNNLNAVPTRRFLFSCFPLKIAGADGSPVRAVALLP